MSFNNSFYECVCSLAAALSNTLKSVQYRLLSLAITYFVSVLMNVLKKQDFQSPQYPSQVLNISMNSIKTSLTDN